MIWFFYLMQIKIDWLIVMWRFVSLRWLNWLISWGHTRSSTTEKPSSGLSWHRLDRPRPRPRSLDLHSHSVQLTRLCWIWSIGLHHSWYSQVSLLPVLHRSMCPYGASLYTDTTCSILTCQSPFDSLWHGGYFCPTKIYSNAVIVVSLCAQICQALGLFVTRWCDRCRVWPWNESLLLCWA